MNFLNPYYLLFLILVPVIAVCAILARRHKSTRWKKLVASRLEKNLVIRHRSATFLISTILSLLGLASFIIALARPYAGQTTINEKVESRNIMIAIDVSKSMLCQDITTDRLTAAKALGIQLLEAFPSDNVGALAFAGTPYTICPLTIDHPAVRDTISQIDSKSIPTEGSDLIAAIRSGAKTLKQTGHRANALIVLSDGSEDQKDLESAIRFAKESNVQIFTIGVGTPTGGVIPSTESPDGKHRDQNGRVVYTKLEEQTLRQLAESTNGIYIPINNNPKDTIAKAISKMKTFEQQGREKVIPQELYHWFLIPGCLLIIAAALTRAKWKLPSAATPALILLALAIPQTLPAAEWWDNLKRDHLEQPSLQKEGLQALQNEKYEQAEKLLIRAHRIATGENKAQLAISLGQAQFRQGNYDTAASTYSSALLSEKSSTQHAAYLNTAHALFKQQWAPLKIKEIPELKPTLTAALANKNKDKGLALTRPDLIRLEQGFTNALTKYQDIPTKDENIENYITSTQQIIAIIREIQQEENEKQEQENKDDEDKKDPKDEKDKKDKGDKGDKDPDEKKDGDKKDDKENPDKPGEKGDPNDDKKPGDEKNEDPQENPDKKPGDGEPDKGDKTGEPKDQKPGDQDQEQPNPNEKDPDKRADDARSALQKHADLQRRPTGQQQRWRGKPPIDW